MPIDHDSAGAEDGNMAVSRLPDGTLVCRVIKPGDELRPDEKRGRNHWTTCPQAGQHRRRDL